MSNEETMKTLIVTVITQGADGRYGWAILDSRNNCVLAVSAAHMWDTYETAESAVNGFKTALLIEHVTEIYRWGERLKKEAGQYREKEIAKADELAATAPPTVVEGGTLDLRAQLG